MLTEMPDVEWIRYMKSHNSGTKKTTPQLLEHIGLKNMKVGLKTDFGRLTTISNLFDGC